MKTWQDAYVEAHAACETDLPHKRLEAGIEAAVNFALAACAAGEWRYDVENAPKDGTYIQGMFKNNHPLSTSGKSLIPGLWHKDEKCWDTMEGYFHQDDLLAFAVPNPPQVTT